MVAGNRSCRADGVATMDHARERESLRKLAYLMDERFVIPGLGVRVGLDGLAGLVPGVGDTAALAASAYIIYRGARLGAPRLLIGRMIANVAVDYLVGLVPVAGDIFDIAFKANRRNVALLDRWLAAEEERVATVINPDGTPFREELRRRWG